jgi:hypothetical protein
MTKEKYIPNNLSRRDVLKLGGLALGSIVLSTLPACAPLPARAGEAGHDRIPAPDEAIAVLYPEIEAQAPINTGSIQIGRGSIATVNYFNYTGVDINIPNLSGAYAYFGFTSTYEPTMQYFLNGNESNLILAPRSEEELNNFLFIVPENAPEPSWVEDPTLPAYTQGHKLGTFSVVKVPGKAPKYLPGAGETEYLNYALYTEVCQASYRVKTNSLLSNSYSLNNQELACNSFSFLVYTKLLHMNYSEYATIASETEFPSREGSGKMPVIVLSEKIHKEIFSRPVLNP